MRLARNMYCLERCLLIFVSVLLLSSCSPTYDVKISKVRGRYYDGNLPQANKLIDSLVEESSEGDSYHSCLLLEEAIVKLATGDPVRSEANLRKVRDVFDQVESEELNALFGEMKTYLTDDRFKSYGGEDFEKILIRVMLAFSNLLQDGEDSIAYANQVLQKQREIMGQESPDRSGKKYKNNYKMIGAGAYLYGLITEERDPSAGGEVSISYKRVKEWEPQFTSIDKDLDRVENGSHSKAGNGVVYIFSFVGKGPLKVEVYEQNLATISEIALQMTRFIPELNRHFAPTLDLSPITISAVIRDPTNSMNAISVLVDGQESGVTETLTDITATAIQQYRETRDWILTKAFLRRMVKKAIVTAAKGSANMATNDDARLALEIGGAIINTLWSASERADTRYWALLPDKIQVLRIELPAGEHDLDLIPQMSGNAQGVKRSIRIDVLAGLNTYVFGFIPTPGVGPELLTTRAAKKTEALTLK